ncbi:hypothetical protein ACFV0Y_05170 [Streptomyces sp. NPDC059569]|uniref:hypothetical protein n=1 Tax=unclassified Streptomyces TaxID=2593676 RepID=UPI0036836A41
MPDTLPAGGVPDSDVTHVTFHRLGFREDGEEWIVGRAGTGVFVALPHEGVRAVRLLESGATVEDARRRLRAETGRDMDVVGFVRALARIGLVSSLDGHALPVRDTAAPTLPGIRPHHVRWILSPLLHAVLLAVVVSGLVAAATHPQVIPRWSDALWTSHGTFVLLGQSVMTWLFIAFHELAHLLTARAAGVPGTIRLGTRLQFLVVQTEVSGVWLSDRRTRMTVYLAGMVLDLTLSGACLLAMAVFGTHPLLSLIALTGLVAVSLQFMVFTRTDIYFALQDLARCRNMYRDSLSYLRHLCARLRGRGSANPLSVLRAAERRVLRAYTALLVVGTAASLTLAFFVTTQVTWVLLSRSLSHLTRPGNWLEAADAATTFLIVGGFQLLWVTTWWRTHGHRVRRVIGRPSGKRGSG